MQISSSVSGVEIDGSSLTSAVTDNLTELSGNLQTYVNILNSFVSITDSANSLVSTTKTVLPNMESVVDNGQSTVNSMQSALLSASGSADSVAEMVSYSFDLMSASLDDIDELLANGTSDAQDLQQQISYGVNSAQTVLPYLNKIFEGAVGSWNTDSTNDQIDAIRTQLTTLSNDLAELDEACKNGSATVSDIQEKISAEIDTCKQQLAALKNTFDYSVRPQLDDTTRSLQSSLVSAQAILYGVDTDFSSVSEALDGYANTLSQGSASISDSAAKAQELLTGLNNIIAEITELESNEQYQEILEMVKADPALLGEFISSPVNLDTVEAYHIDNYGSAMAPFYTILALWVGALILVALIHVKVEPEEGITNVKQY